MKKRLLRYLCVLAAASPAWTFSHAATTEADWQPRLDPPADPAGRKPSEPFVIRLSEAYDASSGRLALELDHVDVTQHVRPLDETYTVFRFEPYTPLVRGPHLMRMVEYRTDGAIVERGRWEFVVTATESAFQTSAGLGGSLRVDEKPGDLVAADRVQAQGSMRAQAWSQNDARRWSAVADLLVDTNTTGAAGIGHRAVDLGDFLVRRDGERTRFAAGYHVPGNGGRRSLVFDGNPRRGVSGTLTSGDGDTALTGFALRTENLRGFEHGLGVGDVRNRIAGGMFEVRPHQSLAVGVRYLSGEGSDSGFGTGGADSGLSGRAGSLSADGAWFDRRLSLHAEAAYSTLDLGENFGRTTDQAYAASLRLQPHRGLELGSRRVPWNMDLAYTRVGSGFRSIGNLQQMANIEEVRAGVNAWFGNVSASLGSSRAEDNIDSDLYPVTRSDSIGLALNWAPTVDPDFGGALFASPTFGLNLLGDWRDTVYMPEGSLALPVDARTRGYTMQAGFSHSYGNWTVTWGTTRAEDHTGLTPDYRYENAGIFSSFQFGGRYSLTPGIQFDQARELGTDRRQRSANLSLGQDWALLVDRLYWNLSLGFNRNRWSDGSSDMQQFVANTSLALKQRLFTLTLQGSYADLDNSFFDPFSALEHAFRQEQFQVFLGMSFNWPNGTAPAGEGGGP